MTLTDPQDRMNLINLALAGALALGLAALWFGIAAVAS